MTTDHDTFLEMGDCDPTPRPRWIDEERRRDLWPDDAEVERRTMDT